MKQEYYINIQSWMIRDLKLTGNKLLVYATIYGFSQDGENSYMGGLVYLQKALRISYPTVIRTINFLINKKYIIKTAEGHYKAIINNN